MFWKRKFMGVRIVAVASANVTRGGLSVGDLRGLDYKGARRLSEGLGVLYRKQNRRYSLSPRIPAGSPDLQGGLGYRSLNEGRHYAGLFCASHPPSGREFFGRTRPPEDGKEKRLRI